jgi:hypothetical protein
MFLNDPFRRRLIWAAFSGGLQSIVWGSLQRSLYTDGQPTANYRLPAPVPAKVYRRVAKPLGNEMVVRMPCPRFSGAGHFAHSKRTARLHPPSSYSSVTSPSINIRGIMPHVRCHGSGPYLQPTQIDGGKPALPATGRPRCHPEPGPDLVGDVGEGSAVRRARVGPHWK